MNTVPSLLADMIVWFEVAVIAYFVIVNGAQTVLIGNAAILLRRHELTSWLEPRKHLVGSELCPPISILAPAYNEAMTISASVRALLTLDYPNLEIVVVNDGSADATMDVLRAEFALQQVNPIYEQTLETQPLRGVYRSTTYPRLVVIDKENGGKSDALNAALEAASGELVCAIDADTIIESDALLRIIRPYLARDDVVGAGGTIRVVNGSDIALGRVTTIRAPRRFLPQVQSVEYLRAFLFGRLGWNRLGGNLIVSGAFGLFSRRAVLGSGGYAHGTVGEDIELVATMRRRGLEQGGPHHVDFVPDPVAWTEVPESLRVLGRQRDRWHRGLAESLWRHRRLIFNPRYGRLGVVVMPFFLIVELLAPIVEAAGLIVLAVGLGVGVLDLRFALLFFLVAYGFGIILSVAALLLEELAYHRYPAWGDRARLVLAAFAENLGYRQLTMVWRLRGLVGWLRKRQEWGAMERRGFLDDEST